MKELANCGYTRDLKGQDNGKLIDSPPQRCLTKVPFCKLQLVVDTNEP